MAKHLVRLSMVTLLFALLAAGAAAQETIGPWTVYQAPASATANWSDGADWLNVANVAVSINESFSGSPILDDGVANLAIGNYFTVTFATPVVNGPGPDLVLFDSRFDAGAYTVATDYDSFAASISLAPDAFVDSGQDRNYYYIGGGPWAARIWGGEVDLTALGVPAGGSVTQVRVTAANTGCDPIGVGSLVAPAPVPALPAAGLLLLTLALAAIALRRVRRHA